MDGFPAELFQILKDDAVKVLHLENSTMATELEKVSIHSNTKEGQCQRMQTTTQWHSSHMLAR